MSATACAPKTMEELQHILKDDIKVKVAVDGVLRGKFMSRDKFISAASSDGFGFCSVIFGWDMHDTVYSRELLISNKANGYRDILARIDLSTYRRIPWEDNVPFFLVSFLDPDTKEPLVVDPRGILKITTERAASLGFECFAGVEYEVRQTPGSLAEKKYHGLKPLTPGMHGYSLLRTQLNNDYFHDIFNLGTQFGVDIEGHHTETGPGVLETALAYTTALRMADNAILFKYLAKSIGMQRGVIPSFMAKPWSNLPGCSGHIHISLRNNQGQNIFALPRSDVATGREGAAFEDTKYISEAAEHFLAGILDGVADSTVLLVPTINGYKRLVGGEAFWAPNAVTYGYDSRAASIRILSPPSVPPSATRFEVRIPGADMNPYFALSAVFLLGLRGIEKNLKLTTPPISHFTPEDKKNGKVKMLPISLEAATTRMMKPESIARESGMLGDVFVEHYGGTREHEVKLWNEAVTDWEVERYIELA
ncbi:glutamine synthetase/guanido kinase [Guyanagaster necrorhizus]|uniref:Glutamine synthetase/guanido kinase n=1 Tax=Guyanagaster necrorhizus TaxID=856835 RepID=A0A9P7VW51_9AGAR|nr:glutamine synthetase/guanido kinase [Guyanagaster necrorhizus MCA 3950]KAG7447992.1 glutamine synthetase/guanido kinase [Guyanagaster necrorhizus MCA 3950]